MIVNVASPPPLDPGFLPAVLWNREYKDACAQDPASEPLVIAVARPGNSSVFFHETQVLPASEQNDAHTHKYVERTLKRLLWQKGGGTIYMSGRQDIADAITRAYAPGGARAFDAEILGARLFGEPMTVVHCDPSDIPTATDTPMALGRNLDGCRIGFDLGGSDRKCAAMIDGLVVYSDEVTWDPYFQSNPQYHYDGIIDSIQRAAAHLPHIDAIGGSAAGVYVNNEPRVASLFRGVSDDDFETHVRSIFHRAREAMGGVPFEVVNDGEVTALAGSMALERDGVLGVAMGTSEAAGFCDPNGHITTWLNELAFVPVDYRDDAPVDEWSGDVGCGAQYFSQQAVARLAPVAGFEMPTDMPFAEQLVLVQKSMAAGDARATKIYKTIGIYLGYAIAHYADIYDMQNLLIMGRVTSGDGGQVMLDQAHEVLHSQFAEVAERVTLHVPDEESRRVGQAVAAASLPKSVQGNACSRGEDQP
jgi:predicted NBD/HSP70 family sugar kinase